MAHPYELTAAQAAAAIRAKQLSPVDLVQALLDRITTLEPRLHAWAYVAGEQAMKEARAAERAARQGAARSPVFGVPYGAKDIFDTAGIPTEAGSAVYKGRVPDADSGPVALLKRAGAILIGKTETTEFADGHPAITRNAWNVEHTPGGSSAGSGAAVGARMVPMALGSQTVGSTLRPAAFNGVVGFKATFGRITRRDVIPMSFTCDHVGLIARDVTDTALWLGVLAGHDPADPDSADVPVDDYTGALTAHAKPPRIGLLRHYFDVMEPAARAQTEQALQRLTRAGATVDEAELPVDFKATYLAHRAVQKTEMAHWHKPLWEKHERLYKEKTQAYIRDGFAYSGVDYVEGQQVRARTTRAFTDALKRYDVLLGPSSAGPAPHDLTWTGEPAYQSPWTFTGFPAISVPIGLSAGMPIGIQFGAGAWQEAKLLGIARWVEQALDDRLTLPD